MKLQAAALLALGAIMAAPPLGAAPRHPAAPAPRDPYYANTPDELIPYRRMKIKPYERNFYAKPQKWNGPGRDEPDAKPRTVRFGFLGTLDPANPLGAFGKQMLQGCQLAIAEANGAGGYKGTPFELMIHADRARWGDSSNEMVRMVCNDQVYGVLGSVDSANSHVMMRVTLKFPVPVVNSATTDQTLMEHRVPFITRVIPDDRQYAYATAWELFRVKHFHNVAMIRINNRDGRFAIRKLVDAARRLGSPIPVEVRFNDGDSDFSEQLSHIKPVSPDAVIVWGNPRETALIVKQMRSMGMNQPIYGWFRAVEPDLLAHTGQLMEGFTAAVPMNPTSRSPRWTHFRAAYLRRFHQEPDTFATYGYDGMNALIGATRTAGLNRVRISDALEKLNTLEGASGTLRFDGGRSNICPIYMAEVRHGRFVYRPAPTANGAANRTAVR